MSMRSWFQLAREAANEALRLNIDPLEAIEKGLGLGMVSISKRFNEGKIFLPQVLAASKAMEEGMKVFEPYLSRLYPLPRAWWSWGRCRDTR